MPIKFVSNNTTDIDKSEVIWSRKKLLMRYFIEGGGKYEGFTNINLIKYY